MMEAAGRRHANFRWRGRFDRARRRAVPGNLYLFAGRRDSLAYVRAGGRGGL